MTPTWGKAGNRTLAGRSTTYRAATTLALPLCVAAILAGCASVPEGPQSVLVPVATSCLPADLPSLAQYSSPTELSVLDDYALVLRIAAERLELLAWASQIIPALEACK